MNINLIVLMMITSLVGIAVKNATLILAPPIAFIMIIISRDSIADSNFGSILITIGFTIVFAGVLFNTAKVDFAFSEYLSREMIPLIIGGIIGGLLMTYFAGSGDVTLSQMPLVLPMLLIGGVFGVAMLDGQMVSPLIGAGMAMAIIQLIELIIK